MSTKAAEKIIDALTQLVEGFAELQEKLEEDYDPERTEDETEESEAKPEVEGSSLEDALVTEIRAAVEAVIENEDCAPEDLASIVSALTDALEEIAPEVFTQESEEDEEDEEEEEDIDLDDEDEDYDEDEDEEDEDEDEDEDEEDEEEEED
jgi:ribonuclease E